MNAWLLYVAMPYIFMALLWLMAGLMASIPILAVLWAASSALDWIRASSRDRQREMIALRYLIGGAAFGALLWLSFSYATLVPDRCLLPVDATVRVIEIGNHAGGTVVVPPGQWVYDRRQGLMRADCK